MLKVILEKRKAWTISGIIVTLLIISLFSVKTAVQNRVLVPRGKTDAWEVVSWVKKYADEDDSQFADSMKEVMGSEVYSHSVGNIYDYSRVQILQDYKTGRYVFKGPDHNYIYALRLWQRDKDDYDDQYIDVAAAIKKDQSGNIKVYTNSDAGIEKELKNRSDKNADYRYSAKDIYGNMND
ncbi:hypothetical protein [Secundilactobacillus yichangensis]|uniref:hypothetical protein n=1 Tax=Secundilactobacillus yichangensis TaxID=2799580 RepID=UPI0019416AF8|nr:hypothetical protein [Secundilactobacillus yichangensis]